MALNRLTEVAKNNTENLLSAAIDAARARATVGEISYACEKVFSRHRAAVRSISVFMVQHMLAIKVLKKFNLRSKTFTSKRGDALEY